MKEYIVPVNNTDRNDDEIFVGFIRKREELIRCKDCEYAVDEYDDGDCYCDNKREMLRYIGDWNHYCGWAKRKDNGKTEAES